ncbi:MAG TPA: FUSC family protein, partial [Stellaceae bacterium]|nr:FUSC family protein [Stellaceae bacterium]
TVAMTLVHSVRRAVTIAGFPLSAWAFALRIWVAMVVALFAAFWLQLAGASAAAVTVAILALQTRGQTYQKAIYWLLATISGIVASFVLAGFFAQVRDLLLIGFAGWLGLCIYVGALLDGNRAFGAILSGYTVAQVAVTQIDSPQNIFLAGVNRGAAILVGIAALALVSELFAAPNVHEGLSGKLTAAHRRVRGFALAILRGARADPIQSAHLLREITALHPDITALAAESSGEGARGAAARSAAVALVAEVSAARALAALPAGASPSLRSTLAEALAAAPGTETRALELRLQHHAEVGYADPHDAVFARHAQDLLVENRRAQDAIADLQAGRQPPRRIDAPIYRSHRMAARDGLRAFLAALIGEILFSLGGWPFASEGLALMALTIALSANTPNPRAFPANAAIAVQIAVLVAGATEFLILDGVDQFPLLAIAMAPVVLAAALLLTIPQPRVVSIAFLVLIYFLTILSPTNPQAYNPETYLFTSVMAIAAVILVFVLLRTVLPTSDALRRRWHLTSARAEMRDLLAGRRSRRGDDEALFRDADRIGQLAALQPAAADERRDDLHQALDIFGCAAAARRVRTTLAELAAWTGGGLVGEGYSALAASDPSGLRRAAADLARTGAQLDHDGQAAAQAATLDLIWAAFLIDASPIGLDPQRSAAS